MRNRTGDLGMTNLHAKHYTAGISGKRKVWGFLFAYPGGVVVSMQVCHAQVSGSSPRGVKTEKCLDHPQMINHKATSTLYQQ